MKTIVTIDTVSYKHNRIKTDRGWLSAGPFFDLKQCRFGQKHEIELEEIDGKWFVVSASVQEAPIV